MGSAAGFLAYSRSSICCCAAPGLTSSQRLKRTSRRSSALGAERASMASLRSRCSIASFTTSVFELPGLRLASDAQSSLNGWPRMRELRCDSVCLGRVTCSESQRTADSCSFSGSESGPLPHTRRSSSTRSRKHCSSVLPQRFWHTASVSGVSSVFLEPQSSSGVLESSSTRLKLR